MTRMTRVKGLYLLRADAYADVYSPAERADVARLIDVVAPPQTAETIQRAPELLAEAEVLLSGWGAPVMDAAFLAAAPRLRAVFYGAGSIRGFVTEALWERGIRVTSAAAMNAVPVAEYTLAAILLSLKHVWRLARETRDGRAFPPRAGLPGAYGSTVGLVSLGAVGRLVCERLRLFDLRVVVYDPYATAAQAAALDVELVALERLFHEADVVSLHAPSLPETAGMITGDMLASMKPGATFINTARGALVREQDLVAILRQRPDIQAILDVTHPEPPLSTSALYDLPNVVLTPHVAGPVGAECRRLGRMMVDELRRYLAGEPLQGEVTRDQLALRA